MNLQKKQKYFFYLLGPTRINPCSYVSRISIYNGKSRLRSSLWKTIWKIIWKM